MRPLKLRSLTLVAAAAIALAGCSSAATTTPSSSSPAAAPASPAAAPSSSAAPASSAAPVSSAPASDTGSAAAPGGDCAAKATAATDAARKPLELKLPTSKLDMASLKGKSLWFISAYQTEFTQTVGDGFAEAATAMGMTSKYVQANGAVDQQQALLSQAVAAKAAGVILLNVNPGDVSAQLAEAKSAGISVVDLNNGDPTEPIQDGIFAHVAATFTDDGTHKANWILADSGCKANVATFAAPIPVVQLMIKAATAQIQKECPDCKVVANDFDMATLSTTLGPQALNVVQRDPSINYIDGAADAFAGIMSPVLQQAGSKVKILGHDGSPSTIKEMAAGNTLQAMTVAGPPEMYIGWALLDQLARGMLQQQPADWALPGRIIDKTNIGSGADADIHPGFEGYQDKFKQAWGS